MHEGTSLRARAPVLALAATWAAGCGFAADAAAQGAPRLETGALMGLQRQTDFVFVQGMDERGQPGFGAWRGDGGWLRSFGQKDSSTSDNGLYGVDGKVWGLQGGVDIPGPWRLERWRFGVMAGAATVRADGTALGNAGSSQGKGNGFGLGLYGNWRQDPTRRLGWYADFWNNFAWFDNHVDTTGLARNDYKSHNGSASAEAGYTFALGSDPGSWTLTPQAQWVYIHNHSYNFVESDGTVVEGAHRGGWSSRLGLRAQPGINSPSPAGGTAWRPYAAINWWHDASGDEVVYNQSLSIKDLYPKDRLELKGGASVALGTRWNAWADLGWQTGSQSYRAWTASLGARYSW